MKVLFAVSNEKISEAIVKKYQKDYKEIISYKNVYYFNAILKEIQRDKTYDRIVISEDLEPFANNDYEAIDKFIFEKLDDISDEATDRDGSDIPIILICSDRRAKSEPLLVKIFGIGVYSALLGQDRSIQQVCELIKKPRTKKEAKIYYKIESEDVGYQAENEESVSEVEIQNILMHYKKLGKDENAYIESFNRIAAQYTDAQLKLIIKFLPINVKAVLETQSQKYQEIMAFAGTVRAKNVKKEENKQEKLKINFIENQQNKEKHIKQVIVPSAVNTNQVRKLGRKVQDPPKSMELPEETETMDDFKPISHEKEEELDDMLNFSPLPMEDTTPKQEEFQTIEELESLVEVEEIKEEPKVEVVKQESQPQEEAIVTEPPKRKRGRPRKIPDPQQLEEQANQPKRKRGRPRKVDVNPEKVEEPKVENKEVPQQNEEVEDILGGILPGFDEPEEEMTTLPGVEEVEKIEDTMLPGMEEEEEDILPGVEEQEEMEQEEEIQPLPEIDSLEEDIFKPRNQFYEEDNSTTELTNHNLAPTNNIQNLLTRDKKVVAFVGTTKNGTSFIVNNLAQVFSDMGIKTAILDVTKNKNAYYIYTKNEEQLRNIASNSIANLEQGRVEGIPVGKNLTVYTSLPTAPEGENYNVILATLIKNYSLVLIDCDFDTPIEYFKAAQEVYLVQSMDILTIQPLTAFLRELKAKNVLDTEKFRVVINKATKVRTLNPKLIIGGISYYNDPAMSFITELLNKDRLKHYTIPFDEQVYIKYLEGLVECKITLNGYPKKFRVGLKELASNVFPLINNKYKPVDDYKPRKASK